jgi:hypothetical protein
MARRRLHVKATADASRASMFLRIGVVAKSNRPPIVARMPGFRRPRHVSDIVRSSHWRGPTQRPRIGWPGTAPALLRAPSPGGAVLKLEPSPKV